MNMKKTKIYKKIKIAMPLEYTEYYDQNQWYISVLQDITSFLNEIAPVDIIDGNNNNNNHYIAKNKYLIASVSDFNNKYFTLFLEPTSKLFKHKSTILQYKLFEKLSYSGHECLIA